MANFYIQGDPSRAQEIKAAFKVKGIYSNCNFENENYLYYSCDGTVNFCFIGGGLAHIIKTHPDYQELELLVEPKFKAEDRIVSKSDKSTIYRIIDLHEERREYIVEIEHKDYHESCPWIVYEDQDDYELAPKPHYDIKNFKPFDKVLVRDRNDEPWRIAFYGYYNEEAKYSHFVGTCWSKQCIPFEGNEHLLGTTDTPSEEFINW